MEVSNFPLWFQNGIKEDGPSQSSKSTCVDCPSKGSRRIPNIYSLKAILINNIAIMFIQNHIYTQTNKQTNTHTHTHTHIYIVTKIIL